MKGVSPFDDEYENKDQNGPSSYCSRGSTVGNRFQKFQSYKKSCKKTLNDYGHIKSAVVSREII